MTVYQVLNRKFKPIKYSDPAKAKVGAAMLAKQAGHESVVAVHTLDKLVRLYRVQPSGAMTRGARTDV